MQRCQAKFAHLRPDAPLGVGGLGGLRLVASAQAHGPPEIPSPRRADDTGTHRHKSSHSTKQGKASVGTDGALQASLLSSGAFRPCQAAAQRCVPVSNLLVLLPPSLPSSLTKPFHNRPGAQSHRFKAGIKLIVTHLTMRAQGRGNEYNLKSYVLV